MTLLLLDLFAGKKTVSSVAQERGWTTLSVDILPSLAPSIVADLTTWSYSGPRPDLLWLSPPCTEFSRESLPWCKTGTSPSTSLLSASARLVAEIHPRFWCLENVRGAVPYLGKPHARYGSRYLWGRFPLFLADHAYGKSRLSSRHPLDRAAIPPQLVHALLGAIENL